ncbi:MAG: DnaA/Hda family protein [Beijerinckiaceae bacterium]
MNVPQEPARGRPARQLAFEFESPPRYGEDDFLVAPSNEAAHAMIAAWPLWPDPVLVLTGGAGAGKSHLAAIWARRARAAHAPPLAIRADAALGEFYGRNILVEDADRVADERGLFHLFNLVQESRASMLLTAATPPERWGIRLPDLLSRLRRAPLVEIGMPDDELVRAVLVKLFVDRQLAVDASVIEYIAQRIDRSLDAARDFVRVLDDEALAEGRRINRNLAARLLGRLEYDEAMPSESR